MSQDPPEAAASTSNYDLIFENALKAYKKKTGKDLTSGPLLRRLEACSLLTQTSHILTYGADYCDKDHDDDSSISPHSSESSSDSAVLCDHADKSRSDSKKSSPDPDHSPAISDQRPAHPFSHYSLGLTPVHCVMAPRHLSLAEYLISKRPQDLHVGPQGLTPSHVAVVEEDVKFAGRLIELSVDVDAKSEKALDPIAYGSTQRSPRTY